MNLQNQSLLLNIVLAIVVVVLSVRLASNKSITEKSVEANQSVNAEQTVLDKKLFLHYFQQSLSQVFTSSKPQLLAYMYTYRAYVVGVFV